MYYQNGNYMQDLNYYNQTPNMGFNPYVASPYANQNGVMNPQMAQFQPPNLNAMYPAVYRIISPVVSQVLANQNRGYLTEENLNNMVDTVYNIVEGDIQVKSNERVANHASSESTNNCERNTPTSRQTATTTTNSTTDSQNTLLKDLIKIMILNEINTQRQNPSNPMMMQNNVPNSNMTGNMFL